MPPRTLREEMIKLIGERMGLEAADAYMFSSLLAVDMRVTQLVDGNKGIHAMLPKRTTRRAGEGGVEHCVLRGSLRSHPPG